MVKTHPALLCVLSHSEPAISTKDFNDWYDDEHAPARLTVPGINSAIRYKATDGETPEWLALYDLDNQDVLKSPEYNGLRQAASENEKQLLPTLPILQRRLYSLVADSVGKPDALPGKYLLVVIWTVQEHLEEEFNKWYDEEHTADVSKAPGWLRGRRYNLVEGADLVPRKGPPLGNYLVIHDWDNGDYVETPEFQASIETEWAKKMLGSVTAFSLRKYQLHKAL